MEAAAIDRRTAGNPRVPLDVLIELSHEDFDEPFEAEGLNLGVGGLSMRASYLPDVGDRLACRFESPDDGMPVEAACEVVWAHDSGRNVGEFGLRFVDIDPEAHAAIQRLVESWEALIRGAEGATEDDEEGVAEDVAEAAPPSRRPLELDVPQAKLYLDGVATPIVARVMHRAADCMIVEQDLPFLRLSTGISLREEDGRRGRIESVDLRVEDDLPRLVLGIVYEDAPPSPAPIEDVKIAIAPDAETTMPDFAAPDGPAMEEPEIEPVRAVAIVEAPAPEIVAPPARERDRDAPVVFRTARPPVGEEPAASMIDEAHDQEVEAFRTGTQVRVAAAMREIARRAGPVMIVARGVTAKLWARLGPMLLAAFAACTRLAMAAWRRAGPTVRTSATRGVAVTWRFAGIVRERLGQRFPILAGAPRRRTTAPPPAAKETTLRKRKQGGSTEVEQPRSHRRTAVLSVIAFLGVGATVYALVPSSDAETVSTHRAIRSDTKPTDKPLADPDIGDVGAIGLDATQPATEVQAPVVAAPRTPTALPEPRRTAGPMPAPTFPTLDPAARPQAPETLPQGSPYAVDVRGERVAGHDPTLRDSQATITTVAAPTPASGASFGAASVPNGRSFTLRMSRTVDGLRGTASANGFSVIIQGALSLDRAGPIAESHPYVARSLILNRGDRAELTIQFDEGRSPPYRVVARGASIEVTIGR